MFSDINMGYEELKFFNNIGEVIDLLVEESNKPHDDFNSVKLYARSDDMFEILSFIIRHEYDFLIESLDINSRKIEPFVPDEYVLIITDQKELFIQSAWNGNIPFRNESKYTVVFKDVDRKIIHNALSDETPVVFCALV